MLAIPSLRRLIYSSRAIGRDPRADKHDILAESRRNNGMDGISGILWSDGDRYLQVLEGPSNSIDDAFDRIRRDARHTDVRILEDRGTTDRQFGDWAMAGMPGDHPEDAKERLRLLLRDVDAEVARFFAG
ncbi:BLUF domain-containing protein [uncultured Sphingomonas sp.]|uniref:BLUF domain-containing protein n=1 Tax=uncultured Sphingomonas sp. TaxID=158754 RepID=UPI0025CEE332|nr:BLUF domain-containing protein [uncultured Sphingomonas sp.]